MYQFCALTNFQILKMRPNWTCMHCKPIPVMKTGVSLWSFSHRKKPVFITGNPVIITGMGLQCGNCFKVNYNFQTFYFLKLCPNCKLMFSFNQKSDWFWPLMQKLNNLIYTSKNFDCSKRSSIQNYQRSSSVSNEFGH